MKNIFLIFAFLLPLFSQSATHLGQLEGQVRAEQAKVKILLSKLRDSKKVPMQSLLSSIKEDHCEEDTDDQHSCAPRCTYRSGNGECLIYGDDYCAKNGACAKNCTYRSGSGDCLIYGEDYCAENAVCLENCTYRSGNGKCLIYGEDMCY